MCKARLRDNRPLAPALLLALGAAFGVIEEGLMVRGFFDPNWPDIAALGFYGRALRVNWIWSLDLIAFHAVSSIAIPNLVVSEGSPHSSGCLLATSQPKRPHHARNVN